MRIRYWAQAQSVREVDKRKIAQTVEAEGQSATKELPGPEQLIFASIRMTCICLNVVVY
jgi:hypothetical protein